MLEEASSRVLLYHPTSPDARPSIRYRNDHAEGESRLWSEGKHGARNAFIRDILRAAYILRHQGLEDEATSLENVVRQQNPTIYDFKDHNMRALDSDPKLEGVRQRSKLP